MTRNFAGTCAAIGLLALQPSAVSAGKSNDTLTFATASEVDTIDIYYQNLR